MNLSLINAHHERATVSMCPAHHDTSRRPGKLALLLNPSAGGGRAGRDRERLEKMLRDRDIAYDLIVTESEDQLKTLSRKLAAEGRAIVGAGGDSTFHLIVNEIMKAGGRAPFGMLGLGSSNDIPLEFGLGPLERAVAGLKMGRTKAIDLGCLVQDGKVLRYFLGQANLGLGVEVNRYVDDLSRRRPWLARRQTLAGTLGIMGAYRKRRVPLDLAIQSAKESIQGSFVVAVFCNTRYWATGKLIAPQARPDDGRLDACLIGKCSFLRLARIHSLAKRGWRTKKRTVLGEDRPPSDLPARIRGVRFLQSAEFTVSSAAACAIQADGQIISLAPGKPLLIKAQPRALRIIS